MAKPAPDPACRRYFSRGHWLSGARPEEREAARWVCTTACTVLPECREWALGLPGTILGIIGGLSHAERQRIRREQREREAARLERVRDGRR